MLYTALSRFKSNSLLKPVWFLVQPTTKLALHFRHTLSNEVLHLGMCGLPKTQSTRPRLVVCGT